MSSETALWIGESGVKYTYYVYAREPDIPKRTGIFIYAKKNEEDLWVPLYIGHGDISTRCADDRDTMARIEAKGATHVHLRVNAEEADCGDEIADLLKRYQNAYEPDGCHRRE